MQTLQTLLDLFNVSTMIWKSSANRHLWRPSGHSPPQIASTLAFPIAKHDCERCSRMWPVLPPPHATGRYRSTDSASDIEAQGPAASHGGLIRLPVQARFLGVNPAVRLMRDDGRHHVDSSSGVWRSPRSPRFFRIPAAYRKYFTLPYPWADLGYSAGVVPVLRYSCMVRHVLVELDL